MRISVVGLGKLGLPLAAVLAAKGFEVVGSDHDGEVVTALNEGRASILEPLLHETIYT